MEVSMIPSSANTPPRRHSAMGESERHKLMVSYLYGKLVAQTWIPRVLSRPVSELPSTATSDAGSVNGASGGDRGLTTSTGIHGVLLRQSRGVYVTQPSSLHEHLMQTVQNLNVEIAFTMSSEITNSIFDMLAPTQTDIMVGQEGFHYQIVDSLESIALNTAKVKKLQYACLVRKERIALLWSDKLSDILNHAAEVERKFLGLVWGAPTVPFMPHPDGARQSPHRGSVVPSAAQSQTNLPLPTGYQERYPYPPQQSPTTEKLSVEYQSRGDIEDDAKMLDKESLGRPLVVTSSIFVGLSVMVLVVLLAGVTTRQLLIESLTDGDWTRMAFIALYPIVGLLSLFFFVVIFTNIFRAVGPISSIQSNSRYYSAIPPDIGLAYRHGFKPPHITIQMPVYKESLKNVLKPTIESLRAAISHYELSGGTASIFVNDDGIQPFLYGKGTEEEQAANKAAAEERMDYYHDNNIGWVARPPHNHEGFIRTGKFKKASNMNFALDISNRTEDKLLEMISARDEQGDMSLREEELYEQALKAVLDEEPAAMAGGNIRMGEIILIVDSDTRVPHDCLIYGAAEMYLNPEVAIIQHNAGVMQVVGDYFENAITFFTEIIYSSIRFAVGHGEAAAFVGHNSFLRWQAVQSVAFEGENGKILFWSDKHVSEDFDMALRLQIGGNVVRMASYHGDGFKEGVSLTVHDELARWEKYSYGCNELVFNPIYTWPWKGPFTGLFIKTLTCNIQLSSKISILGYIFSYYGIASGLPLTVVNYFLVGWFNGYLDKFYLDSWKVFVTLTVVFALVSNVTLALLRYRLGEMGFLQSLWQNFKWMPLFFVFFGGLSFHLNLSILSHMFSINMEWGATAKELEFSNFFKEVPKIFNSYKWMFMFCIPMVGAMIYLGCFAPRGYEINGITAVIPLAICLGNHILMPFVLNPALMVFNY